MGKADKKKKGRPRQLFTRDITEDRQVSKFYLDDAAEQQADAYGYWSDLLPKYKKKIDDTELEISIISGEKYSYYKETLDGGNDSKGNPKLPTEGAIANAIAIDADVIELKRQLNEFKEIMGLIVSAVNTMDQRRSMIKILDGQSERGYFDQTIRDSDQARIDRNERKNTLSKKDKMRENLRKKAEADMDEDDEEVETEEIEEDLPEEADSPEETVEEDNLVYDDEEEDSEEETDDETDDESDSEEDESEEGDESEDDSEDESEEGGDSENDSRCPFHHRFGQDFGNFSDCDECDEESPCFRESKKY